MYLHYDNAAVGRDPFLHKSLLGGDPPEGYPAAGMWVKDVCCDNDVVEDIPSDTVHQHADTDDGGQHPPCWMNSTKLNGRYWRHLAEGMHCTKRPKLKFNCMRRMKKTLTLKMNWMVCTLKPPLQCTRVQK